MSNYLHTKALGEAIKKLYILGGKRYHPEPADMESAGSGIMSAMVQRSKQQSKPNSPAQPMGNTEESFGQMVDPKVNGAMMNPWLTQRATEALKQNKLAESATMAPVAGLHTPQGSEKRISDAEVTSQDIATSRKLMKYGTMFPQE